MSSGFGVGFIFLVEVDIPGGKGDGRTSGAKKRANAHRPKEATTERTKGKDCKSSP